MSSGETAPVLSTEHSEVFRNSRREAIVIFSTWVVALLWAVPYCYFNGYGQAVDPETFSTTLGIPSWLFGGILLPWVVADVFTTWFSFAYMKDDDLGIAGDEHRSQPATGTEGGGA